MTQFSNKLKNLFLAQFGPIFPILWAKKFSQKIQLSCTTSHGILAPCQNFEKINDTIPRKLRDRWKDERRERRTNRSYFIGPFRLLSGVQ